MEIALWTIYGIGVGCWLAFGVVLLILAELLGSTPKDSTVLKYLFFASTWPISWPLFIVVKSLGLRITKG